ncbi:MAG: hypothetical protein ABW046_00020 [Actinoplanes sp.]
MPPNEPEVPVTILIEPEMFAGVAASLAAADDVRVDAELPAIGVISARVPAGRVAAIEELAGVRSVEPERGVQLPPPESGIQ